MGEENKNSERALKMDGMCNRLWDVDDGEISSPVWSARPAATDISPVMCRPSDDWVFFRVRAR